MFFGKSDNTRNGDHDSWAFSTALAAFIALVTLATACGGHDAGAGAHDPNATTKSSVAADSSHPIAPIELTDDAGSLIHLDKPAQRVVSLIPSATETLIDIGATKQIVGRTRYDVAPDVAAVPSVGGGVDPSVEAIVNLKPDIVIAWASDKRQAIRAKLAALHIPVFVLDTEDTTDIFRGIHSIGRLTGHDSSATAVAAAMRASLDSIKHAVAGRPTPSVLYVVFADPPMTTGPHTFIGQLLALVGARSIFPDANKNWPNVAMEEIVRRDPDILIVPVGEFKGNSLDRFRKMAGWRDLRAVREGHVVSVSADILSRPSPSIVAAAHILLAAVHPEVVADSTKLAKPAGTER